MPRKNGIRTFLQWWNSIPNDLKKESKNICNKNIITNVNYILLKLTLYQMNYIKPTIEEMEYWLSTGQIKNRHYMKKNL